ncbi:MAG: SGNH/GDSL hydrolase family protein [Methylococcaceae bacterium]
MNRTIASLASLFSVCGMVSSSFATAGESQPQTIIAPEISEINNLQHLIDDAVNEVREINYIVAGDSTKEGRYEQTKQYYAEILRQLNIQYVDNSVGGLDASEWISGVDSQHGYHINETVAQAISQTPGLGDNKGENTILEFSLGINDYFRDGNLPEATFLETIKQGLDLYIAACPKTEIILVTPVHFHALHSAKLNNIYAALSAHYGFKLIDVEAVTKPVYHSNNFYIDYVHPSAGGARRVVNYILNEIVPDQYSSSVTLPEYIPLEGVKDSIELAPSLVSGHYDVNTGDSYKSTWQRLPQFDVIPNRELTMVSTGNRRGIIFLDANEEVIGESEVFHNSPSDSTLRNQDLIKPETFEPAGMAV